MCNLACDLKSVWRQNLQVVQTDVTELRDRVQKLEDAPNFDATINLFHSLLPSDSHYRALIAHMDNLENCKRRNNIQMRGVPESIWGQDLTLKLTKFLISLPGRDLDTPIELDCTHRALRSQSLDPALPRDITCRIHLYSLKENFMCNAHMTTVHFRIQNYIISGPSKAHLATMIFHQTTPNSSPNKKYLLPMRFPLCPSSPTSRCLCHIQISSGFPILPQEIGPVEWLGLCIS